MKKKKAYRAPVQEFSGYKTLVTEKSQKGILPSQQTDKTKAPGGQSVNRAPIKQPADREKERALPLPSDHSKDRDKKIGPTYYNKNRVTPNRTKDTPGEEYGHPTKFDYYYLRRRKKGVSPGKPFPLTKQKKQKGPSRMKSLRWYRRNGPRVRRKMKRKWKQELKRNPNEQRKRKMRRKYPKRYERKGFGYGTPAERSRDWRKKKKLERQQGKKVKKAIEKMLVQRVASGSAQTFHREQKSPQNLPQNWRQPPGSVPRQDKSHQDKFDRAPGLTNKNTPGLFILEPHKPAQRPPEAPVYAPGSGSGKVIPENQGFVNHKQRLPDKTDRYLRNVASKMASKKMTIKDVLRKTSGEIKKHSKDYRPREVTRKDGVRRYRVGEHDVRFQEEDWSVSCTCPAWMWTGSEYWAKRYGYLFGKPRGTATRPRKADPRGVNLLCKHVVAVLEEYLKREATRRVASRYLENEED